MKTRFALRWVALFEFAKGLVVVLATTSLPTLLHHNLHDIAVRLMAHTHLNPAAHYPGVVLDAIDRLQSGSLQGGQLQLLALGALAYAAVRFAEAWGLFFDKAWAEVLAAGSGAIYVPFELFELVKRPSALGAALLLFNLAVVAVMLWALRQRR